MRHHTDPRRYMKVCIMNCERSLSPNPAHLPSIGAQHTDQPVGTSLKYNQLFEESLRHKSQISKQREKNSIAKLILKFIGKWRGSRITSTILKKNKVGGFPVSNFRTYYEATAIKTVWYQYKDGHTDQLNRTESPGTNPYIYDQLILGVPR